MSVLPADDGFCVRNFPSALENVIADALEMH